MSTHQRLPAARVVASLLMASPMVSSCISLRPGTSERQSPVSIRWIAPADTSASPVTATAPPPLAARLALAVMQPPHFTVQAGVLLHTPRIWAQSARLGDGRVLVAGGMALADMPNNAITASTEIYDPATNAWSAARDMAQPRYSHFLFSLPDGEVIVLAGARDWDCCWTGESFVRAVEIYDPAADTWRVMAELPQPRSQAAATMPDDCIWLSGGRWLYSTHAADSWLICSEAS